MIQLEPTIWLCTDCLAKAERAKKDHWRRQRVARMGMKPTSTLEQIEIIRSMAATHTAPKIAKRLGVSSHTVKSWAKRNGIKTLTMSEAAKIAWADPAVRAKRKAGIKRGLQSAWDLNKKMQAAKIEIPHWVPDHLHAEFRKVASQFGEEKAASHIRHLKQQASA